MNIKGLAETIRDIQHEADVLRKAENIKLTATKRVGDQVGERGTLADRLAQKPEEAQNVKRADDARLGLPSEEEADMSQEELTDADNKTVDRMIDDILRNLLK